MVFSREDEGLCDMHVNVPGTQMLGGGRLLRNSHAQSLHLKKTKGDEFSLWMQII